MPNERATIVHVDRRVALGGLVAAALSSRGLAQQIVEPPETGPLSPRAVGELLAQYKVPGASLAIIDKGDHELLLWHGAGRSASRGEHAFPGRFDQQND